MVHRRQFLIGAATTVAAIATAKAHEMATNTSSSPSRSTTPAASRVHSNTTATVGTKELGAVMRPGVSDLGKGKYPGLGYSRRENDGILIEKDVEVTLRDGKKLYANIYRPKDKTGIPAIICYAPFGKHPHIDMKVTFAGSDVPFDRLSDETIFEVFDPIRWGKDGYAIIIVDGVGNWSSEGEALFFSPEEARAGYDVVEWAAKLDWCSGKIGWGAVSYYAMSAWEVAALKPPHLAAIMPWEGASDVYRETYFHGGIPTLPFNNNWMRLVSYSKTQIEDMMAAMVNHPLIDDYWRSKVADWSKIEVPTYAVTDWPNDLHLRGTVEAWRQVSSKHKYLDISGDKEWQGFYQEWAYKRQKAFFDHFLKGIKNDVPNWSKVRVALRHDAGAWTFREEHEFPLARTQYRQLFLDAGSASLSPNHPSVAKSVSYVSTDRNGEAAFDIKFNETTEITGYSKLRLWIAATGTNDADLFVGLEKLDKNGKFVDFRFSQMFDDGPIAVGWLRVSQRELDPVLSRPERPVLTHAKSQWLQGDAPVAVDIEIWPTNVIFESGETLRVVVRGTQISNHPGSGFEIQYGPLNNAGDHVVYTGGQYDSHLLLPVIPKA
ncbi:CocE/NonD family hydrolase [Brenneria goodwinii]|uniref:CocE/NonD family hydrolase n=1 Tax=Brenneria goodwinii TaxID=1109412 RepID=UPI0036EE3866